MDKEFFIFYDKQKKLDVSFPVAQFCINGFSTPYRLDRNQNGGVIIIYARVLAKC